MRTTSVRAEGQDAVDRKTPMENIIKKLNEIDENPLMRKEVKKLCRAYAAEVVRYFESRRSHCLEDGKGVRPG